MAADPPQQSPANLLAKNIAAAARPAGGGPSFQGKCDRRDLHADGRVAFGPRISDQCWPDRSMSGCLMSRANASQLNLFEAPGPAIEPPPPDPDFARKHLTRLLRLAQRAERMPWSPSETRTWETLFPQLAQSLPEEERREMCEGFAAELARLRA